MDSYCDLNNAYLNKGLLNNKFNANSCSNDLEQLARCINNNKKTKSKDIYRQYQKESNKLDRGVQSFNALIASQADKGTNVSPYNHNPSTSDDTNNLLKKG